MVFRKYTPGRYRETTLDNTFWGTGAIFEFHARSRDTDLFLGHFRARRILYFGPSKIIQY